MFVFVFNVKKIELSSPTRNYLLFVWDIISYSVSCFLGSSEPFCNVLCLAGNKVYLTSVCFFAVYTFINIKKKEFYFDKFVLQFAGPESNYWSRSLQIALIIGLLLRVLLLYLIENILILIVIVMRFTSIP